MQVLKFGGTSVANAERIRNVKSIVEGSRHAGRTIVVVSAFSGITDQLILTGARAAAGDPAYKELVQAMKEQHLEAIRSLMPITAQSALLSFVVQQFNEIEDISNGVYLLRECSPRTRDRLTSYGELISSRIISDFFNAEGLYNEWWDARALICTDDAHTRARVHMNPTVHKFREALEKTDAQLFLLPGFMGSDKEGHCTTLGRGGSDYTAAIAGAATNATAVEIWTDVSGIMTADPRLVSNARSIPTISYNEAMELSHFGAKVIYPPTLQPLMNRNIPVWIKNSFAPEDMGTMVTAGVAPNGNVIRGISSIAGIALLSLEGSGMVGIPGFSKRLFEALAKNQINVILITQASSEHSICVGIEQDCAEKARQAIDLEFETEIQKQAINPLTVERELAIIALVGDQMKSHPGISGRMFGVLGRNGVNVRAIAQGSSERNISAVISARDIRKALNVLHEEFFEQAYRQVNVFIVGTGNVGGRLLAQMAQQQQYLQDHLLLQIRIIGLANSRRMAFDDKGIDPAQWKEALEHGEHMDLGGFVRQMKGRNLRNAVFVDATASDKVAAVYEDVFLSSISVVACNKIACSSPMKRYRGLKELTRNYNSLFHFETNVGASLPIIGTLNDLLRSGDKVNRIEAVLSGTLNFVFNNYDGSRSFAAVVRQAQEEGYTEPDPRLDLSGMDVMRKIMILIREAGYEMEMDEIANTSFMPPSCMEGTVEDFYREMEKEEPHFRALYEAARSKSEKLKFVASFNQGKASVGLKHIGADNDFFHLYGKDNIVQFFTNRYTDLPMVIKGAGAGADVTASGVFADIIRSARL